jgi:Copper resistance protein ScsC N-terminal domain
MRGRDAFPAAATLAAALVALATPASAQGFTEAQRAEIVGILRDALRSDPSILREALEGLDAAERREREGAGSAAIAAHAEALFRDPADPAIGNPRAP